MLVSVLSGVSNLGVALFNGMILLTSVVTLGSHPIFSPNILFIVL